MTRTVWPLEEVLDRVIDHRGKTPKKLGADWTEQGVQVVSAKLMIDGRLDLERERRYVSAETYRKWMPVPLEVGDVLLTSEAPLGAVAYLTVRSPLCLGQRLFALRAHRDRLDPRYLYYLLRSQTGQALLAQRATGTTVTGIRQSELLKVRVELPPVREQAAVAALLGALDDKIDVNLRLQTTVRQLGFAELKRELGHQATLRSLGSLVRSIARGVAPKYVDRGELVLNQRCIRGGMADTAFARQMEARHVKPEKRAEPADVLINSTGVGTLGRTARWAGPAVYVDGHVTVVRPDPDVYPPTVLAYALMGSEGEIEQLAVGSTGQTELGRERLTELQLELPDPGRADELEGELERFEVFIQRMRAETATLTELRDALLPKLLSGELRVQEAEVRVEAAG